MNTSVHGTFVNRKTKKKNRVCENTYIINSEMERTSIQVRMWERTSIEIGRNGTKIEPFCLSASPISFLVCHAENHFFKKNHQRTFHYDLMIITTIARQCLTSISLLPSFFCSSSFSFLEKRDELIFEVKKCFFFFIKKYGERNTFILF